MTETNILSLLIAAISGLVIAIGALVTAVVYMYKRNEKREANMHRLFVDCLNKCNNLMQKNIEMLDRVEKQANWRSR